MDMEIARLVNVAWLQIPDRQLFALRASWSSPDASRVRPGSRSCIEPQPVPMLDWPADLFDDVSFCQ